MKNTFLGIFHNTSRRFSTLAGNTPARHASRFSKVNLPKERCSAIEEVSNAVKRQDQVGAVKAVLKARKDYPENWNLYLWEAKLRTTNSLLNRFGADPGLISLVNDWYDQFNPDNPAPKKAEKKMSGYKKLLETTWSSDEVLGKDPSSVEA